MRVTWPQRLVRIGTDTITQQGLLANSSSLDKYSATF